MKFLIIGPSWVGDMVMAQALFISLRHQHPDAAIDVLAPHWCRELLQRMPEVRHALTLDIGHGELGLGKRWKLGKVLAKEGYDQAIVLPNSFKSALIPLFARIPVRTGWRGEARNVLLNDCRRLDKSRYPLMVERFVALAYPEGQPLPQPLPRPALQVDANQTASLRAKLQLNDVRPILVLCPGAEFGPSKQWPETSFAEVARHHIAAGHQVWILGSAKDKEVGVRIGAQLLPEQARYCFNLCGLTSLGDAIDLMAAANAVVSNDSGLMHVAAALGLPLVVVYGSTSAGFTPPLADRVRTLSLQLSCSPCFKRTCPLGHHNCMKQLHPNQVIGALAELSN
ncbi:MAG: lipopolysaccharide heptosyltransferase II [Pseudomonadota bacterium]